MVLLSDVLDDIKDVLKAWLPVLFEYVADDPQPSSSEIVRELMIFVRVACDDRSSLWPLA